MSKEIELRIRLENERPLSYFFHRINQIKNYYLENSSQNSTNQKKEVSK